jgi:hypothetical protein
MNEVEKSLRRCIVERGKKIAPSQSKYAEWWRVLSALVNYDMVPEDRETFQPSSCQTYSTPSTRWRSWILKIMAVRLRANSSLNQRAKSDPQLLPG